MSCYVGAHASRRAERWMISSGNLIADVHCHVLSPRVDSTRIHIYPTSRLIHTTQMSYNRGAAGDNCESTRSGDITPELTRRAHNASSIQASRMTATLFAVGLNELLGFVGRSHSASPDLSTLSIPFNKTTAAWRFNSPQHQLAIRARG